MSSKYLKNIHSYFTWLLLFFIIVYIWRLSGIGWIVGFSDHLSNFALTGMASILIIGPGALGLRRGRTKVLVVSAMFVLANLAVEIIAAGTLGGFNVVDSYDALYGIAASVIIVGAHLLSVHRRRQT